MSLTGDLYAFARADQLVDPDLVVDVQSDAVGRVFCPQGHLLALIRHTDRGREIVWRALRPEPVRPAGARRTRPGGWARFNADIPPRRVMPLRGQPTWLAVCQCNLAWGFDVVELVAHPGDRVVDSAQASA